MTKYQFCYARTLTEDVCTDLKDILDQSVSDAFPGANIVQQKLLSMLVSLRDNNGNIALHVDDHVHWIFELEQLQNKVWATLQVYIADFAMGAISRAVLMQDIQEISTPDVVILVRDATSVPRSRVVPDDEKVLCASQLMRKSGRIVNINVFGHSFIVAFSILVNILDITLLKFLVFFSRFRHGLAPRIERWIQDGAWQLQRRAYEDQGHRGWIDVENDVLLITDQKLLVDLTIT